jgi:BRCA1-associated protein
MAGEGSSTGVAALGVGPTLSGRGTATKAKFLPLETKNTEIGWGIVHLYREGHETPSLDRIPASSGEEGEAEGSAGRPAGTDDDCTTLCIPAVPSYLSPADFLGFVGEKWRDDILHYRMVMTETMNRYLVLMKFREGPRAKEWKKEFDGRNFNSMEVSYSYLYVLHALGWLAKSIAGTGLSRCLRQVDHLRGTHPANRVLPGPQSRSLHADIFHGCVSVDQPQAIPSPYAESDGAADMSGMLGENGRYDRPYDDPVPTRLPLPMSTELEG